MTLLEVLIATILVAGALASLSTWAYKAPWNQSALRKHKAQLVLEDGMKHRLATVPVRREERIPLDAGWSVHWTWRALPERGWMLTGEVLDARGKIIRQASMARWWP